MRDVLGPGTILGYCTNVHAGATLEQTRDNLARFAVAVRSRVSPSDPLGIGLWLSSEAIARQVTLNDETEFGEWMLRAGLLPFTLNGFPFGDFHQELVKHQVYVPSWSEQSRAGYSIWLASSCSKFMHGVDELSISTLPVGWQGSPCPPVDTWKACFNLHMLATVLENLGSVRGLLIHLDLEPEPGCMLQRSDDVLRFFEIALLRDADVQQVSHHIRICHDICHAAVMFEDQAQVLRRYRSAGIKVGKVQISNAIRVPFDEYSESERREALQQLRAFAEDRYLHQTMIRMSDGEMRFFEDLPLALASVTDGQTARGEWRVHFHVPVFLERFGLIQTTQREIRQCLTAIERDDQTNHYEIETYAWNVLPQELRTDDLVDGIARELLWVKELARELKK